MPVRMEKYIGQMVEVIYLGRDNKITQRTIQVHSIKGGTVKAYCLERQAPRTFQVDNILAVQPVMRHVV